MEIAALNLMESTAALVFGLLVAGIIDSVSEDRYNSESASRCFVVAMVVAIVGISSSPAWLLNLGSWPSGDIATGSVLSE